MRIFIDREIKPNSENKPDSVKMYVIKKVAACSKIKFKKKGIIILNIRPSGRNQGGDYN